MTHAQWEGDEVQVGQRLYRGQQIGRVVQVTEINHLHRTSAAGNATGTAVHGWGSAFTQQVVSITPLHLGKDLQKLLEHKATSSQEKVDDT